MAIKKNDGGPAFPRAHGYLPDEVYYSGNSAEVGMSLRDWFAGKALNGIIVNFPPKDNNDIKQLSIIAYQIADAMMEAK